jgi:hypothetical protein
MKAILEKLMKIQELAAVPKSLHNDFAGFNYRSAEQILEEVKPIVIADKCVITLSDEVVQVGSWNYVKATATITDTETGERHSTSALAREQEFKKGMDTSQITGSTSSYARKYALSGLLALDDNKDADSMDNSKPLTRAERIATMSPLSIKKGDIAKELYDIGLTKWSDQTTFIVDTIAKETVQTEEEADRVLERIKQEKELVK